MGGRYHKGLIPVHIFSDSSGLQLDYLYHNKNLDESENNQEPTYIRYGGREDINIDEIQWVSIIN